MLEQMTDNASKHDDEEAQILYENTLDGLRQVMAIKARAVLPYLVPQLITPPVNTRALASLAPVSGEALHRHLPKILPALISAVAEAQGNENEGQQIEFAEAVILSVSDEDSDLGMTCILEELMSGCTFKRDDNNRFVVLTYVFADFSRRVKGLKRLDPSKDGSPRQCYPLRGI